VVVGQTAVAGVDQRLHVEDIVEDIGAPTAGRSSVV
jgi:hypothetical protein